MKGFVKRGHPRSVRHLVLGGGAIATAISLAGLTSASATTSSHQRAAAVTFAGQSITIVVGSSAGGGQDSQARIIASYLGNYLPGHPTVTVSDVPANSGTVAMVDVAKVYPANGLYLDLADGSLPLKQLYKAQGANYKMQNMGLVAAWEGSGPVAVRTGKAANAAVLESLSPSNSVVAAAVSPGSMASIILELGMTFLKIPYKMVFGYASNGPIALAFKAGSADASAVSMSGFVKSFAPNNDSYLLYQFGFLSKNGKDIVPDPYDTLNGSVAPTIEQLWQQQHNSKATPTGGEWTAIKKIAALDTITDQLLVRQGTKASVLSALQKGFKAMESDPTFQTAANPLLGEPLRGPSLTQAHKDLLDFLNTPHSVEQLMYAESGYVGTSGT